MSAAPVRKARSGVAARLTRADALRVRKPGKSKEARNTAFAGTTGVLRWRSLHFGNSSMV